MATIGFHLEAPVVFLDGWHEDFESYEEAVSCFARAAAGGY
jgi:hypothetical protein